MSLRFHEQDKNVTTTSYPGVLVAQRDTGGVVAGIQGKQGYKVSGEKSQDSLGV
jgi:hypothetical protein